MASALDDKARIIPFMEGVDILDVGAGGGEFALRLADLGYKVTALDILPKRPGTPDHPNVEWIQGQLADLPEGRTWDTVVASSVMHEIFSYEYTKEESKGGVMALVHAVRKIREVLKPGGRFIIRDGVAASGSHPVMMEFTGAPHEMLNDEGVKRFLRESPFAQEDTPLERRNFSAPLHLRQLAEGTWEGNPASVMEAFMTLTWGKTGFAREVQELYGIFTLEKYRNFIMQFGFKHIHSEEYLQPGYVENAKPYVKFTGFEHDLPSTNALWVFENPTRNDFCQIDRS